MADHDILIRNAQLRSNQQGDLVALAIADGRIKAIGRDVKGTAAVEIDARGNLVTESFADSHMHLCKVYTRKMMDDEAMKVYLDGGAMGTAMTGIELAARVKEKYKEDWIIKNVRKVLALGAIYGTTHIRGLADVDTKGRLEGVKALLKAREEFKGIINLQVTPFAQDGVVREPGTEELMRQAMDMGCDAVGGIPWIEYTDADIAEHVRIIFDIAVKYDKPVSMLVDDAGDPGLRSLEVMALETIKRGWYGRSLAHHARAMSLYPTPYLMKLAFLLNKARMGVVTDPHTGPLHLRVKELLAQGCLVCIGQDDISDAYYSYGRENMMEVAFLASHLLWMTSRPEMETIFDMVTTKSFKAIGIDHALKEGAAAHLVVHDQPNVWEVLRFHEAPAYVISHGRVIDREKMWKIARAQE